MSHRISIDANVYSAVVFRRRGKLGQADYKHSGQWVLFPVEALIGSVNLKPFTLKRKGNNRPFSKRFNESLEFRRLLATHVPVRFKEAHVNIDTEWLL